MAEARYWRCSNPNCRTDKVQCDLPVCPECHAQQPVFPDKDPDRKAPPKLSNELASNVQGVDNQHSARPSKEPGRSQRLELHQTGGTEEHRVEIQQRTEQQRDIKERVKQICHNCGYALERVGKFCSECGTSLAGQRPHQHPQNTADISTVHETQTPECYFCTATLHITDSGENRCLHCRKKQPREPQGPPCIHGCGVRLLIPGAKSCARCGGSQLRTPTKPADVSADSQHASNPSPALSTGYGYPNNSPTCTESSVVPRHQQLFGQQVKLYTVIHLPQPQTKFVQQPCLPSSVSGLIQSAECGTSDQVSEVPLTDTGKSTGSPTISDDGTPVGHPASALRVDGRQEKMSLQKPIQESSPHTTSSITRLQDSSVNVGNNDDHQGTMETRKRKYDIDSGGSRKQTRLENNKHIENGKQSSDVDPTISSSGSLGMTSESITTSSEAVTHVTSSTTTANTGTITQVSSASQPLPTVTTGAKPSSGDIQPSKTSSVSLSIL